MYIDLRPTIRPFPAPRCLALVFCSLRPGFFLLSSSRFALSPPKFIADCMFSVVFYLLTVAQDLVEICNPCRCFVNRRFFFLNSNLVLPIFSFQLSAFLIGERRRGRHLGFVVRKESTCKGPARDVESKRPRYFHS